ncbi:hypothetical protein NEUTE2DRAFT_55951, partial [Neurospora tetrasperma FGSC 2509]
LWSIVVLELNKSMRIEQILRLWASPRVPLNALIWMVDFHLFLSMFVDTSKTDIQFNEFQELAIHAMMLGHGSVSEQDFIETCPVSIISHFDDHGTSHDDDLSKLPFGLNCA